MAAFTIKLIATITMLIDHIGFTFSTRPMDFLLFRQIGRISFPLFVFLIAEGCLHTKDIKKYMKRLFVFALISQIPYFMLTNNIPFALNNLNILFTLFFGVLLIYLYKLIEGKHILYMLFFKILFVFSYILADTISVDYGGLGVTFVLFMYYCKISKYPRLLASILTVVVMFVLYLPFPTDSYFFAVSLLSIIPMVLYNKTQGFKKLKLAFYIFYPLHLLVLSLILLM
ncbi:MAG: conjugal transfer protein TraX [Defluviitaleaceae bacterium]|nr:conjugal transfer protein TraX [Defluviitaleaceae bacterium]